MMIENITPDRIANAIMQNTSFNGYYLIVEGTKDYNLYSRFVNDKQINIKEAFGYKKVLKVINILTKRGFDNKIGIIDSDFRRITNDEIKLDGLFMTDDHDIEVMIIKTKALTDVLRIYCSKQKIDNFEKKNNITIRDHIMNLGKEIGYLKLANKLYDLGLVFKPKKADGKQIKYKKFISTTTLSYLGDDKLIDSSINYSCNKSKDMQPRDVIKDKLSQIKKNRHQLDQLVNGHDLSSILFILMKNILNSKKKMLYDFNSVEDSLTLAYNFDDFKKTELFKEVNTWAVTNDVKIFNQ